MKVEDIILSKDKKGISRIKKYLSDYFCKKAAEYILNNCQSTIIATGFYTSGKCENDGLVGAINLAKVLSDLGANITFVTDKYCIKALQKLQKFPVIEFPIGEIKDGFVDKIIEKINPTLIIAIERPGRSRDDRYYNYKMEDITEFTAKIDILFEKIKNSIGIGDLGNEIGMGNLYDELINERIYTNPSKIKTKYLIPCSVSNWGCYGIIAYISKLTKKDYLDNIEDLSILKKMKSLGIVDGITGKPGLTVDGFLPEETQDIIKNLKLAIQ